MEPNDRKMLALGLVVVFIVLAGAFSFGKYEVPRTPPIPVEKIKVLKMNMTESGEGQENAVAYEKNIEINVSVVTRVTFTLTWTDEPDADARHTNTPDSFTISVASPEGEEKTESGDSGMLTITFIYASSDEDISNLLKNQSTLGKGLWNVTVSLGECGDQEPLVPDPLGLRTIPDDGNSWELKIVYEYATVSEEG